MSNNTDYYEVPPEHQIKISNLDNIRKNSRKFRNQLEFLINNNSQIQTQYEREIDYFTLTQTSNKDHPFWQDQQTTEYASFNAEI